MPRLVVLGIEGLNPELVEKWIPELPNLESMQQDGLWGTMEGTIPPGPPQSWASALTGRNPGVFGFWDWKFRNGLSYDFANVDSTTLNKTKTQPLYKTLELRGKKIALINVPGTCPTPRVMGGYCVSPCSADRKLDDDYTWPKTLKNEIAELVGEYIFETSANLDRGAFFEDICKADQQKTELLKYFFNAKACDFVYCVLAGAQRVGSHREADDALLKEYYRFLDNRIREIRASLDPKAVFLVHSDHGANLAKTDIDVKQILIQQGHLVLTAPGGEIDWSRTKAWVTGNNGAIYLNVQGREEHGIVPPSEVNALIDQIAADFGVSPAQVLQRKDLYPHENAQYGPDVFMMFNDRPDGYFCLAGPGIGSEARRRASLLDIVPTVMVILKESVPKSMEGSSLVDPEKMVDEAAEAESVHERLSKLGY